MRGLVAKQRGAKKGKAEGSENNRVNTGRMKGRKERHGECETRRTMGKRRRAKAEEEYKERKEKEREKGWRRKEGDSTMHASAQFAPSFQIMI